MVLEWSAGHWTSLVQRIHAGDNAAVEELYTKIGVLVRGKTLEHFSRMDGGYCLEDHVHEVLLIVLESIYGGGVRDPERLPAFIRTVSRRRMIAGLRRSMAWRRFASAHGAAPPDSPEAHLNGREKAEQLRAALDGLSRRDREILERFYLKEQPAWQICGEMQLTETQFRLYKSRAIAKCSNFVVNPPGPAGLRIA